MPKSVLPRQYRALNHIPRSLQRLSNRNNSYKHHISYSVLSCYTDNNKQQTISNTLPFSSARSSLQQNVRIVSETALQYCYFHSTATAMADDASYSAFLSKANQDLSTTTTSPSSSTNPTTQQTSSDVPSTSEARGKFDPTTSNSSSGGVPKPLSEISVTHTSDTDSEFEPVFFSYSGSDLPSVQDFKQCLGLKGHAHGHAGEIEELSVEEFDGAGAYTQVFEKVKEAGRSEGGNGELKVFRVQVGKTRVEYYVLTVGERKLLGVVAKAVES